MISQGSEINCSLNFSEPAAEPVRQCSDIFQHLFRKDSQVIICVEPSQSDSNLVTSMDSVKSQTSSDLFSQNSETKILEGRSKTVHWTFPDRMSSSSSQVQDPLWSIVTLS